MTSALGNRFVHSFVVGIVLFIKTAAINPIFIKCKEKWEVIDTNIDGLIAAFGDFDSNRFTDVFVIDDDGHSLKLLRSFENGLELLHWPNATCNFPDEKIVSVIPGDFGGDGKMDVMLVTNSKNNIDTKIFNIYILNGDRNKLNCGAPPIITEAESHPLILDYNGDMVADFIVQRSVCSKQLWTLISHGSYKSECLVGVSESKMRFPHSNAFVNILNCRGGLDYSTDMFFTGQENMEYWFYKNGFYSENIVLVNYPDEKQYRLGQSIFIDLNKNGCTEHIMTACKIEDAANCMILWFDFSIKQWMNISDFKDDTNQTNVIFEEIKSDFHFTLPMTVRAGDIDGDGFVDLLAVMKDIRSKKHKVVILKNVPSERTSIHREFKLDWSSDLLIDEDVELASLLDVQENGKLDIIMTVRDKVSGSYKIKWIQNNLKEYSCFLKVLVTTGLCSDVCPNEKIPYGTNQPGPFVCYETADMNGNLIKGCNTQLSQSGHFSLQTPYSVFGLGETPNFVDNIVASMPTAGGKPVRKSKWTQIVPDAQVVLIPYPPNETAYWICKLFYTPSSMVFSTLITLAIMCLFLVVIICVLHRKEVLEDLAEHEHFAIAFSR